MTTQAEDLGKLLGTAIIDAADKHGTAIVAASIHIHTGLSQIAEALGGRSARQPRQDALGRPRMPGARGTATEPERDAQDATQPEWATAAVVQDNEHDLWGRHGSEFTLLGDVAGAGSTLPAESLERNYGPLTVIIDADGNPVRLRTLEQSRNDIAGAWTSGYQQGLKDVPAPLANGNPPARERCGSEHPSNPTVIPCQLDAGHDGPHYSSTGCAGSGMSWGIDKDVSPPASLTTEADR